MEPVLDDSSTKRSFAREECGVCGIYRPGAVDTAPLIYFALCSLQHRGQESAGISIVDSEQPGEINTKRGKGLVIDYFTEERLSEFTGGVGIGHVRYSTAGGSSMVNSQPLVSHSKLGPISIAHNGNLVNALSIREMLEESGAVFHTRSDSEVILNLIARKTLKKSLEDALKSTVSAIKGSYSLVILIDGKLVAIRDSYGIRPLCLGKMADGYVVTSESCALDAIGAELIRDIEPGEIAIIDENGIESLLLRERVSAAPCIFELIYFARPDSIVDGVEVYQYRRQIGRTLFKQSPVEADVVIGVPDSGIPAAHGLAEESGFPFEMGLVKSKYVGRSFISPEQDLREKVVNQKLNPVRSVVVGRRVIVVEDSIVRATTSRKVVNMLRRAGAKEVHFYSASPKVVHPCFLGIDTPDENELVAANHSVEEIRQYIEADSLIYLERENLYASLGNDHYCDGCFSGSYPIAAPVSH